MRRTFLVALFALSLPASAAVVSFSPTHTDAMLGQIFNVSVGGSGFPTNADGGGFDLTYNPAVLDLLDITIDPGWDTPVDEGDRSVPGKVTGTKFAQFTHPMVGSFPILTYQFQAKAVGTSNLHLDPLIPEWPFSSGGFVVTPLTFTDGSVQVVPEPQIWVALLAGLSVLVLLRLGRA